MPRKARNWVKNSCYHITHRCKNKEFLFKFDKYKKYYKRELFEMKKRYNVNILNYMITDNHVHLLVKIKTGKEISNGLRYLHGRMGQWHNQQKHDSGAFWSDRFHSTRIQDGKHLGRCLFYIDLNMVRAGVVKHPSEWKFGSYDEFLDKRKRCCIINKKELLNCLNMKTMQDFQQWYSLTLDDKLNNLNLAKQAFWSKAIAVGNEDWLLKEKENMNIKQFKLFIGDKRNYFIGKA